MDSHQEFVIEGQDWPEQLAQARIEATPADTLVLRAPIPAWLLDLIIRRDFRFPPTIRKEFTQTETSRNG